jgi:hypothetical protein
LWFLDQTADCFEPAVIFLKQTIRNDCYSAMFKKISIPKHFSAALVAVFAGSMIACISGCSQERYEDSQWDEGASSSTSSTTSSDGTTLPAVGGGTTLPAAGGTTLPAGRGTTLPSGRGTTLPSGNGTTLP